MILTYFVLSIKDNYFFSIIIYYLISFIFLLLKQFYLFVIINFFFMEYIFYKIILNIYILYIYIEFFPSTLYTNLLNNGPQHMYQTLGTWCRDESLKILSSWYHFKGHIQALTARVQDNLTAWHSRAPCFWRQNARKKGLGAPSSTHCKSVSCPQLPLLGKSYIYAYWW